MITIDDFAKLELKVGTIINAEDIEGSEKLIKLKVDLGEEAQRQILAGIKEWYSPEDLIGKQFVFITNLEPRVMMGLESQGMILAADSKSPSTNSGPSRPIPIKPSKKVPNGAKIR